MSKGTSGKLPLTTVGGKFNVQKRIGSGCFGDVYRGVNNETGEEVAMKLETKSQELPQLKHEAELLEMLAKTDDGVPPQGFTAPYFYFGSEGAYLVMVMPILSRSIEDCVQMSGGKISVKSALMIADQILRRIEYLHSKGLMHRDIKSENFMCGAKEKQNIVYIIDFGLTKPWHQGPGKGHIPFKKGQPLTGTARFASIKVHHGHEQGRRDDLEAIGHMFMYFLRGTLPWQGLEAKTAAEKYQKIVAKKEGVPIRQLCDGFPQCFATYLETTRNLGFKERPDYDTLRKLFTSEFAASGFEEDFDFDWFKGKKPEKLTPLPAWTALPMPDDGEAPTKEAGGCCTVQ